MQQLSGFLECQAAQQFGVVFHSRCLSSNGNAIPIFSVVALLLEKPGSSRLIFTFPGASLLAFLKLKGAQIGTDHEPNWSFLRTDASNFLAIRCGLFPMSNG